MNPKKTIVVLVCFMGCLGCEDILEEPDISTRQVAILAPLENAVLTGNRISFNWESLEDARAYHIQIATPAFANAAQIMLDSLIIKDTLGNLRSQIDQQLLNGDYQWRVKAINGGFETPFTISSFKIEGDPEADIVAPNIPQPETPADGSIQDETEVNFSWMREDITGSAELDSIYIYSDENLQTLELKGLGANKTFNTSLAANTYYWLVRAFDKAGNLSDASVVFTLTIN